MSSSLRFAAVALAAGVGMGTSGALADGYFGGSVKDAPAPVAVNNWSGLYIGAAVGYGIATTEVDVSKQWKQGSESYIQNEPNWGPKYSIMNLDGLSSEGAQGTLTVGYDRQISPSLLIGIFGDYTFGDLDNDISLFGGVAKLSSQVGENWSIGGRIGLVRQDTLWYAMAGYTETDLEWDSIVHGDKIESGGETLSGYFVGLGVEHQIFKNVSLKLEYRYSDYDGLHLSDEYHCKKFNLDTDTDIHSVRVGFNVKFDPFHRTPAPAPLK